MVGLRKMPVIIIVSIRKVTLLLVISDQAVVVNGRIVTTLSRRFLPSSTNPSKNRSISSFSSEKSIDYMRTRRRVRFVRMLS